MKERRFLSQLLETKYFGLIIGLAVFAIISALSVGTIIVNSMERKVLDLDFQMKQVVAPQREIKGVSVVTQNARISPSIMIIAIDDKSIARLGKWPFPRHVYADYLNALQRIKNQDERELASFIDVFFVDPDRNAVEDADLIQAVKTNQRVLMETVLTYEGNPSGSDEEYRARQEVLRSRFDQKMQLNGDWKLINSFKGSIPPLKPYARVTNQYGHANFVSDEDQTFRQVPLIAKIEQVLEEIPLEELDTSVQVDPANYERLAWTDKAGIEHEISYPLTAAILSRLKEEMIKNAPTTSVDSTGKGEDLQNIYVVEKYRDQIVPSVSLVLALEYFHKSISDIKIDLGREIVIPSPQVLNEETQALEPYRILVSAPQVDQNNVVTKEAVYKAIGEIRIPIDEHGAMQINFAGPPSSASLDEPQTFPVRPFSGYAGTPTPPDPSKWPPTKKVANMILFVGAFTEGVASDQKPTPFGLMYGVEIHANALNTILTNSFLHFPSTAWKLLILFVLIMGTSLLVSRFSTIWSLVASLVLLVVYFFVVLLLFDLANYAFPLVGPAVGVVLAFLAIVAYRTVFEERDKRRIRDMFSKYVSPAVVDDILKNPPELGGVDKDLTVFFSDIRSFTTLSESMTPQELVNHLNQYLTAMTDLILDYQGTLDKYVGDEIMCFWGAPLPQPDHALLACKCALRQIEVLKKMNEAWPTERRLSIGIGLNTGTMTVANMGSTGRMNYTLMGDNVNLGARLEGTNKGYFTTIIISEYTYAHVKDRVVARELDNIRVKGKNKPVLIYELLDVKEGLEPPEKTDGKAKGKALAGARS
jgi:adenylate cyclase